jgi:membrane associated rhomboid family serine protease
MNPLIDSDQDSIALSRDHFRESLIFPVVAVCAMWAAHLLRLLLSIDAGDYGIISRSNYGLRGIVTAPLVHGSWGHLISNTFPMFVLSGLLFYFYQRVAYRAFWLIYFATGIAVWLFARPVSHVGASGVVYGLVSFIFWNGIFRQSLRSIILALLVLFFYSGMFMGILPDQEGISWESHLIGSLAGTRNAQICA